MTNLKDTCAIVGIGETMFGKHPGVTAEALNVEACKKAIEDSGLTKDDVDGLLTQQPYRQPTFMFSMLLGDKMGLSLRYATDLNIGGATPVAMVQHAVMAINAGLCNAVVCTFGEPQRSFRIGQAPWRAKMCGEDFENPFYRVI